jgi:hypothetical protein
MITEDLSIFKSSLVVILFNLMKFLHNENPFLTVRF